MEFANTVKKNKYSCHDCGKKIKIEKEEIKNGTLLVYENEGEKYLVYKCEKCFKKNTALVNFRECEVYSRVVGYLRPVSQWHVGKKQEFSERKEYKQDICS